MITVLDTTDYYPYMTHRYEVPVNNAVADTTVFPQGYKQEWTVTGVTPTCEPEELIFTQGEYTGRTSVVTDTDRISVYFESQPIDLTIMILWRETIQYGG